MQIFPYFSTIFPAPDVIAQKNPLGTPQKKERNPSVIILGTPKKTRCESVAESPGQEGFLVTYCRPSDTDDYPHPRSACPHHPFSIASFNHIVCRGPYQQNAAHCDKCYCYVCDKPAKEVNDLDQTTVAMVTVPVLEQSLFTL
ncbi:Hypp7536 [Branchiostoma lanceolatum]|uniref:Hypp7536 protein n=1 Tax=Branchiostoma lanceolatum TaxID=7740 RepID=A0A8K0EA70_BRALA|nr:Hypp7536 [Branchiostoma lanceolatum]